jgi:SnoaL-like domain
MGIELTADIDDMLAERAIRKVLYTYSRGIDRRDFELVRSCYHPDATDDHGHFKGSVDGFIEYASNTLLRFERTMHFLGNILIDREGDTARSETYAVAYHRMAPRADAPLRDYVVGLRYVDRFDRRSNTWRITRRVCALEWSRMDDVVPGHELSPSYTMGIAGPSDPLYSI